MKRSVLVWLLSASMIVSTATPVVAYDNTDLLCDAYQVEEEALSIETKQDNELILDEADAAAVEQNDDIIIEDIEGDAELLNDLGIIDSISEHNSEVVSGITDFVMPDDYHLELEQLHEKELLPKTIDGLNNAKAGVDYADNQVFAFADSEAEANLIAQAYNAELESYSCGIAVFNLREDVSVITAVSASADISNNLPAVYPNYYVSVHDENQNILKTNPETSKPIDDSGITDPYAINDGTNTIYQWFHSAIGSGYAWGKGYRGQGINVAVIDSGVQLHSDLEIVENYNCSTASTAIDSVLGHGTHVAGIIGARANGKLGVGVAPEANVYNIRVLDDNGSGTDSDVAKGINKAVELNVDLINMSLGGTRYNSAMQILVDKAYKKGIAIFASAGNDGGCTVNYPAAYNHTIAIGATDTNNQRALFSNYGTYVDFSAPGTEIWSTYVDSAVPNEMYKSLQGTSMSCPVATGSAAVILSAANDIGVLKKNGTLLTGSDRVDALVKLMKDSCIKAGPNVGKGIIYLPKALSLKTLSDKPSEPQITINYSVNSLSANYSIKTNSGSHILYTTNGKTPSYKNGKKSADSYEIFDDYCSETINMMGYNSKKIVIKAMAISDVGLCSKVVTKSVTFNPNASLIRVSGPKNIAIGKKGSFYADIYPGIAKDKAVNWSLSSNAAGISISKQGAVSVSRSAKEGTYYVKAALKNGNSSDTVSFNVISATTIKSVKFTKKSVYLDADDYMNGYCDVSTLVDAIKSDGTKADAKDFYYISSNPLVAYADKSETGKFCPVNIGTTTITAIAGDGSGKKATVKLTVRRKADSLSLEGTDLIAKGKTSQVNAVITPDEALKTPVEWSIDSVAASAGIRIKNGKVSVPKNVTANQLTVYAKIPQSNGTVLSANKIIKISNAVTEKLSVEKKSITLFTDDGYFGSPMTASIRINSVGGDTSKSIYRAYTDNSLVDASITTISGNSVVNIYPSSYNMYPCKVKVTVEAVDGSNKKASINVNYVNPASSVQVGREKSGEGYFAVIGDKTRFTAIPVSDYGQLSSKKVTWSVTDYQGKSVSGANISSSGVLSLDNSLPVYKSLIVRATMADGSKVSGIYEVYTVMDIKSLKFVASNGKNSGTISKAGNGIYAYALINKQYFTVDANNRVYIKHSGLTFSSSNPNVAIADLDKFMEYNTTYYAYRYKILAKGKGSAKITVTTKDKKRSASFTVKVLSN